MGPGGLDPAEVFETLPKELQEAFGERDVDALKRILTTMDPEDAKHHMQRCIDSGLWDPSGGSGVAGADEDDAEPAAAAEDGWHVAALELTDEDDDKLVFVVAVDASRFSLGYDEGDVAVVDEVREEERLPRVPPTVRRESGSSSDGSGESWQLPQVESVQRQLAESDEAEAADGSSSDSWSLVADPDELEEVPPCDLTTAKNEGEMS